MFVAIILAFLWIFFICNLICEGEFFFSYFLIIFHLVDIKSRVFSLQSIWSLWDSCALSELFPGCVLFFFLTYVKFTLTCLSVFWSLPVHLKFLESRTMSYLYEQHDVSSYVGIFYLVQTSLKLALALHWVHICFLFPLHLYVLVVGFSLCPIEKRAHPQYTVGLDFCFVEGIEPGAIPV